MTSQSQPLPVSAFRSHLLNVLSKLPGARTFHLHIIVSAHRKPSQSLFPYADTRPKCFVQDILVLLSEQSSIETAQGVTDDWPPPRTFVSAIEASVFAFPTSNSTILYVSKVDGTGQGLYPSPTSTLVRAFIEFYASPSSPLYSNHTTHHLWVHLFARAQRQYLFPNSGDHPLKNPLGDVGLCKWWKKTLTEVAKSVSDVGSNVGSSSLPTKTLPSSHIHLFYLLPGQSELEAMHLLRETESQPSMKWVYSHPYDLHAQAKIPYLAVTSPEASLDKVATPSLAYLIPHFDDDPKRRFLDELAVTSENQPVAIPTPKRKRRKTEEKGSVNDRALSIEPSEIVDKSTPLMFMKGNENTRPETDTSNIPSEPPLLQCIPPSSSPPPFGERCLPSRPSTPEPPESDKKLEDLSPHTPNFPTLSTSLLSPHTPTTLLTKSAGLSPQRSSQTPRTPRRPKTDLDNISIDEFWERMSYRQECLQGAVTGFFTAVFSQTYGNPSEAVEAAESIDSSRAAMSGIDGHPTLLIDGTVPHTIVKRIMSSLLTGVEFSNAQRSHKGTHVIESAIKGLCEGLEGRQSTDPPPSGQIDHDQNVPARPSAALDIYHDHVYASISVNNSPLVRKPGVGVGSTTTAVPVNVLSIRRKKKREIE